MSGMTEKETTAVIAWHNREMNRMIDEIRRLREVLELKESEYQATIEKANLASKMAREYQDENTQLKMHAQSLREDVAFEEKAYERLREENGRLKNKERIYDIADKYVIEQSKKVKHLFPQENRAGYGQLCDKILELENELKGIGAEQYYTLQAENRELRKEIKLLKYRYKWRGKSIAEWQQI